LLDSLLQETFCFRNAEAQMAETGFLVEGLQPGHNTRWNARWARVWRSADGTVTKSQAKRGWQSSNGEQPASGWSGEEEGLEPGEAGAGPAPRGQQHLDRDEHEVDRQSGEGGGDQEEQGGDRLDAVGPLRQQSWVWWSQETGYSLSSTVQKHSSLLPVLRGFGWLLKFRPQS